MFVIKRRYVIFVLLFVIALITNAKQNSSTLISPQKIKKIVIDAGHGGHDPGAVGKKYKEKDLALAMTLKLGGYINENFPDVEVIYTRKTDVFIELYKRAQIANENHADLFISIHCNSASSTTAQGTETWVMGLHKSQANLEVAKKENATILLESDYMNQYDGFDPNSPEANIIFSLYQNVYLEQSLELAAEVQDQFENRAGRGNRGVKQAGFLVLYKTTMPGILVEAGFISNPTEEEYLGSENGQALLASAIYRAFKVYKNKVEKNPIEQKDVNIPDADSLKNLQTKNITNDNNNNTKTTTSDTIIKNNEQIQEIYFRVQFATSNNKKSLTSPEFKNLQDVKVYFHNGLYKYTTGNLTTLEDAVILQGEVQQKGFKDAFVVAFLNETRISPDEAVSIIKNRK